MSGLTRDSFEYERHGRIVGEDDHRAAIRARVREILRVGGSKGRSAGVSSAAGAGHASGAAKARARSNETVLKVVAWTKAKSAPFAQATYAARTRESDAPERALPMFNETGRELRGAEIAEEIRSWGLMAD